MLLFCSFYAFILLIDLKNIHSFDDEYNETRNFQYIRIVGKYKRLLYITNVDNHMLQWNAFKF